MTTQDQSAEREAFEKWASDKMRGILRVDSWMTLGGKERTGYYSDAATAWSWAAWRAALSAREEPAREEMTLQMMVRQLERIANNTDTDPRWLAAQELRRLCPELSWPQAPTTEGSEK